MRKFGVIAWYVILSIIGLTMILPLVWMVAVSLASEGSDAMDVTAIVKNAVGADGGKPHFENYKTTLDRPVFAWAFFNSALVTAAVTFGLVFTSSLAAYAFARLRFFGRDKIFLGYLATMMVPSTVTMIPTFIILRWLDWTDTYYALIIPPIFSAYGVFMLRQFFLSLPVELEEAATLDGCTKLGIYWNVVIPLSTPALAALSILTFLGTWRSFMWPLIVTYSEDMYTLPLALAQFQEMFGVQWVLLMAGSVIMILPMLVIFILGQRFFVEGIQLGAVKG